MNMHDYHEALPGYHPDQVWHDGCGECERRGEMPLSSQVGYLDAGNLRRALRRAAQFGGRNNGDLHISKAEAELLRSLYVVYLLRDTVIEMTEAGAW